MIKNVKLGKEQVVSQVEGNIVSDMDGEKVMLSIHNGKYYNLGDIGGDIWDLITKPISIEGVIAKLQLQYDVETEECEEHVLNFLHQLHSEGLIKLES
ncbi:lasso peptide biosynthesis PqqD family chaperone [Halalkalibacter alkalisediminis]|uniref:Lasso peptide biosynthesis PqqD family chaperone n=1 Tax=Halalkalibacter alkalisediminis TaxID=935616 RepID=A0ABV6NH41_9BACI|nr:lasso peptide biosynthesis PqqD family chaperone [Halalkalibacter alkalisediminis]